MQHKCKIVLTQSSQTFHKKNKNNNKQGNLHLQHTSANNLRQRESRNVAA